MIVHWIKSDHPVLLGCGIDPCGPLCSTTKDLVTCPECKKVIAEIPEPLSFKNMTREEVCVAIGDHTLNLNTQDNRTCLQQWLKELIALRAFRAATEDARQHLPKD